MNNLEFEVHSWEYPPPHPLRCTIFLDPKHGCHGDTGKPAIKAGLTSLGISYSSNPKQNELEVRLKGVISLIW